jgi:glycosyltransferase involved in cell wall biosynthesis
MWVWVVATDCGGPRDIIEDGINGFLVPVGDVDAIVERVQLLLADADIRMRMQARAQETIRRFTWEKCVDELERALHLVAQMHLEGTVPTSWREMGRRPLGCAVL